MPMQRTFTPIIWTYQSFETSQINEVFEFNELLEPYEELTNLIDRFEVSLPDMPETVLQEILSKI
jgi:hypothetical protein